MSGRIPTSKEARAGAPCVIDGYTVRHSGLAGDRSPWKIITRPAAAAALVDERWMPSGIIEGGRELSADEILGVSDEIGSVS